MDTQFMIFMRFRKEKVLVYSFGMQENFMQYSFNEMIPVGIYPGFEIRIADLLK
ncbi:MAG: hypothetical protein MR381_08000 [Dorea sp.]|nr:hypothetical protein [Dorea sp.]